MTDEARLLAAVGDAARSMQSVVKSATADPDRFAAELNDYTAIAQADMWGDTTPERARAMAREHILLAVACMDAARQMEANGTGGSEAPGEGQ